MGRKVIGYGVKGDRIWGLNSFEVIGYGVKGDRIWGVGDKIWGNALERMYLKGKTVVHRSQGHLKVIRYGATMNDLASPWQKNLHSLGDTYNGDQISP